MIPMNQFNNDDYHCCGDCHTNSKTITNKTAETATPVHPELPACPALIRNLGDDKYIVIITVVNYTNFKVG